jgi:hypothetical protein
MANSLLAHVPLTQCPDSAQQSRLLATAAIAVQSGGAACLRLAQALRPPVAPPAALDESSCTRG